MSLLHVLGVYPVPSGGSPWYQFWSGSGSDFGEYAIVGALLGTIVHLYSTYNCHDPEGWLPWGCWRIGRHPAAGGLFRLCKHHHPDLQGKEVSRELIHKLHRAHKERTMTPTSPGPVEP